MTTDLLPRFARKETRALAQEAVEAGFVYVDDDTKGHALFIHADSGYTLSLSETPGRGQIKRVRDIIAKATGNRRGGFDRARQRERQAAMRDVMRRDADARARAVEAAEQRRSKEAWERWLRQRVDSRWRELRSLDFTMRQVPGLNRGGRSPL